MKLLEEAPTDGEGLDMLLQTQHPPEVRERLLKNARGVLIDNLQKRPGDVTGVRRLVKVARALSDDALQQAGPRRVAVARRGRRSRRANVHAARRQEGARPADCHQRGAPQVDPGAR